MSRSPKATTLYLVRHGDRWDFANQSQWRDRSTAHGLEITDPPLSALGHEQARCAATEIIRDAAEDAGGVDLVLSSPYLRTLQTAQALVHAVEAKTAGPIDFCIEWGLAEAKVAEGAVSANAEKLSAVVPELETGADFGLVGQEELVYDAACTHTQGRKAESMTRYLERQVLFARRFTREAVSGRLRGKTVVCYSHAASVAVIAALVGTTSLLSSADCDGPILKFAPAGIYKLTLRHAEPNSTTGGSQPDYHWTLLRSGASNEAFVTRNSPTTFPWSYAKFATYNFLSPEERGSGDSEPITDEEKTRRLEEMWKNALSIES